MKTAIVLGIGSFMSLLFIVGLFFALMSSDPAMFGAPPENTAAADTLTADSTGHADQPVAEAAHDTTPPAVKPAPVPDKVEPKPVVVQRDTTDWKSKAKLFEAMDVTTASNILQTMNDAEVRQIIPHIKKRNAAKILASFDPGRAARIIR
ncbi:MAG: hypothetical protein F9K22_01260 [Bacteroidetes bacterium]|nr:MAG: hypothetical protein F9K22_01260 [Bacteroidota bacterium]